MRTLSTLGNEMVLRENAPEPMFAYLTLDLGPSGVLYFVNNWEGITRGGNLHLPYYFNIRLPSEDTEADVPEVVLEIDNIDPVILSGVQLVSNPIPVTLAIAMGSTPDTTEAGPYSFSLKRVDFDEMNIQGHMTYETTLIRAFPHARFLPNDFPGAF